jgi:energy-coupling factor transporter transmembrane protein EcfT
MILAYLFVGLIVVTAIAIFFLPNPYYAIGMLVIYASTVVAIGVKLRTCLSLAQGSEFLSPVHAIVTWFVFGVFCVVAHLVDLFRSENRDYIMLATNLGSYLALQFALGLVEQLLKRRTTAESSQ